MNEIFFTSKGPRRGSQVRQVRGGTQVRQTDRGWELRTFRTDAWTSIDHEAAIEVAVAPGGWQSWSSWTNRSAQPIASFVARWTVPAPPAVANGQTIYLFSGLQDAAGEHIVQPVLQWGPSPARGSTNAWGLASFWVGGQNDLMFTTHWEEVAPGTVVIGRMTLTAQNNGLFSCTAEFDGYPATQLTSENLPAMVDCVLTLEAYGTGPNAPYPEVSVTEFSAISIAPDFVAANVRWAASGGAVIKRDGGTDACIDVAYPVAGA
ncbi:hypothetical protein QCM80_37730 [Bradyrhizobium sp. SSUT112]|uniref:hypothetical protein n=1 Tax=Bradyrhizobium sp. SSUT112 TaxID=3040604 RepID=UPI00244861B9|nr:hypothetical protein [Bradyrhizobium sp. SSUT112]MDH2356357.1 hypothetical protein [Bradyrhizobium sp. SSUT112]